MIKPIYVYGAEVLRLKAEPADLSDREGSLSFVFLAFASVVGFAHGQPKKRPCDDDGQLRHFLVEVFEGVERLVGLLYLVYEEQGLPGDNLFARGGLDEVNHRLGVNVRFVDPCSQKIVPLQIDLDMRVGVEFACKLIHKPGLSDLPRPHEYERLALGAQVPVDDFLKDVSLHYFASAAHYIIFQSRFSIGKCDCAPHFYIEKCDSLRRSA